MKIKWENWLHHTFERVRWPTDGETERGNILASDDLSLVQTLTHDSSFVSQRWSLYWTLKILWPIIRSSCRMNVYVHTISTLSQSTQTLKRIHQLFVIWNVCASPSHSGGETGEPLLPPPLCHLPVLQAWRCYAAHWLRTGAATVTVTPACTLKATGHWSSAASERYLRPKAPDILIDENAFCRIIIAQ